MKTIELKLYSFNELSEDAKKSAIRSLMNINVDHNWFDFHEEDAKRINAEIVSFDIYNSQIDFKVDCIESTCYSILDEHGENCFTYLIACKYLKFKDSIVSKYEKNIDKIDILLDELENETIKELGDAYLDNIKKDYEYLLSDQAIIETIEANDYDFTELGELY